MRCRDYTFLLTSEQLDHAGWARRAGATAHRLMCRQCRAFTRHDQRLTAQVRALAHGLAAEPDPPTPGSNGR